MTALTIDQERLDDIHARADRLRVEFGLRPAEAPESPAYYKTHTGNRRGRQRAYKDLDE